MSPSPIRFVRRLVAWLVRWGLAALLLGAGAAHAQGEAFAATPAGEHGEAAVKVENRTLFTFRAPIGAFTPAQRAEAARERVRQIVQQGGPLVVTVQPDAAGNVVFIDGQPAFAILPGDVNPLLHQTLPELTRETVKALEDAAAAHVERRSPAAMLRAALVATAATAAFVLFVWAVVRLRRVLMRRIEKRVEDAVSHMRSELRGALSPQAVGGLLDVLAGVVAWGASLSAAYVWLTYVLAAFPFTRPWGLQLEGFLVDTATRIALAFAEAIPDLFIVVVIVLLTRAASRLVRAFFERLESGQISIGFIDPFTAPTTRRLVSAGLWVFALAMVYPYLPGSDTDAFKGVSVLVGLMVSLGASSVVGQAASGLILTYSQAFKPGEFVRIGDTEGTLTQVGLFSTRIATGLGELVVLPNSFVLANTTKNYSRAFPGTGFVMDTTVTIGYSTPWRQVHAMLVEAARRTAGVATTPQPRVAQIGLSDFYPEYRLICYAEPTQPRERAALLSELHAQIQDVFNEHGVQIMSPHYMADPPQPQVVPKERWYDAPAERPADGART
jgi:small-conductance mechanosensitive channel